MTVCDMPGETMIVTSTYLHAGSSLFPSSVALPKAGNPTVQERNWAFAVEDNSHVTHREEDGTIAGVKSPSSPPSLKFKK